MLRRGKANPLRFLIRRLDLSDCNAWLIVQCCKIEIIEAGHSDTNSIKQIRQIYIYIYIVSYHPCLLKHIHSSTFIHLPTVDYKWRRLLLCQAPSVRPATEARQKESRCVFFHSRVCRVVPPYLPEMRGFKFLAKSGNHEWNYYRCDYEALQLDIL